jgi:hypothetical protein
MAIKREDKYALAKARRERAFSNRVLDVKTNNTGLNPTAQRNITQVPNDSIYGTSGPISEATSAPDFINRLLRNYTVDVGDATSRVIQDTSGQITRGLGMDLGNNYFGGKGNSSLFKGMSADSVSADLARGGLPEVVKSVVLNNFMDNPDAMQMTAPGDFSGASGLVRAAGKGVAKVAKPLIPIATSKIGKVATAGTAGAVGTGLVNSEQAQAWSPKALIVAAKENPSVLKQAYDTLPMELIKSLEDAARKQNNYTSKRLSQKRGEAINKAEWFADGVGITGKDMWDEAVSFFNNNPGFTDEAGNLTQEGINLAEGLFTGSRGRSLQWSHIKPLEEARNAVEPFIAQGPGKAIFTYPRVNRLMGSQNMIDWAQNLAAPITRSSILKQLGM